MVQNPNNEYQDTYKKQRTKPKHKNVIQFGV